MNRIFLFLVTACPILAQTDRPVWVSWGFKLGAPINDSAGQNRLFSSTYTQGRWTGGPTIELHLPYRFAIEADALYRTNRGTTSYPFQWEPGAHPYNYTNSKTTNAWDFPLLLKYRFHVGALRPFISAGYSWTRESSETASTYFCSGPQGSCRPTQIEVPDPRYNFSRNVSILHGPAAGVGIEFKTRHVTISPELRFNRPTNTYPRDNRFTGMVGFTFGKK